MLSPPLPWTILARHVARLETDAQVCSQLALGQGVAQHLFDAGIVALAGCPYALDDIGGEAEPDMDLRCRDRRTAHPFPCLELLRKDLLERFRLREILFGPLRNFRLVPLLFGRYAAAFQVFCS